MTLNPKFLAKLSLICQTTPRRPAPPFIPLPLAAAKLMHTQLSKKPANLKNATRDMDLSSWGVREDVNMERNTAGVTGNRLDGLGGGGCSGG